MSEIRWRDTRSVTLDASGAGEVFVIAGRPGVELRVRGVQVQGNSAVIPVGKVYEGTVSDSTFRSGTYDGNNDADNDLDIVLQSGERISVAWTGGTAGATMRANFTGFEVTPDR